MERAQSRFARLDMADYPPITFVGLAVGKPALLLHWTGRDSLVECNGESAMPLTSSSFDARGVEVYRRRLFRSLVAIRDRVDIQLLLDFHASHSPTPSAYSPCMHRDNAETVSFSKITVCEGMIDFLYYPRAPCQHCEIELQPPEVVQMRTIDPRCDYWRDRDSDEGPPVSADVMAGSRVNDK